MTAPASVFGNYLGNQILVRYLRDTPNWLGLHIDDPTGVGVPASEVAGLGYLRQRLAWSEAGSKTCATTNSLAFVSMPALTLTWLGVWDAPSGGNLFLPLRLPAPIPVPLSGHFLVAAGDIAVTL